MLNYNIFPPYFHNSNTTLKFLSLSSRSLYSSAAFYSASAYYHQASSSSASNYFLSFLTSFLGASFFSSFFACGFPPFSSFFSS